LRSQHSAVAWIMSPREINITRVLYKSRKSGIVLDYSNAAAAAAALRMMQFIKSSINTIPCELFTHSAGIVTLPPQPLCISICILPALLFPAEGESWSLLCLLIAADQVEKAFITFNQLRIIAFIYVRSCKLCF